MADGLKICENNELMLELSIGGIFVNIENPKQIGSESVETHDGPGDLDFSVEPIIQSKQLIQSKPQIQATGRGELRRKREEMLKKSEDFGSCGSVSGPFVENKEWLEKQIAKQNDDVLEIEPARKKERVCGLQETIGFNATGRVMDGFVNPEAISVSGDGRDDVDGGGRRICKLNSNSSGGASSVYSDGQCSSHQDYSGSNSSDSQLDQQLASANTSGSHDQPVESSKQTVSTTKLTNSAVPEPRPANPSCKPDQTRIQDQHASVLARMPCVSTTGNGPNGRTISGFLYRYTKNEVSIVCVCHGQSFNPAGFVEHAGGVDVAHPLKHIIIFPTAFAS